MSHNGTCPVELAPSDPVPFFSDGNLNFKAHQVGWIICGFFSLIASGASFWLIWKHLTYYTCPQQQRHIIRMLIMVPIYAIVSTLSYVFFQEGIYYQTIRDCYEAVVITSFFNLLLQYVGDTPAEQHEVFRQVQLKKWFFPLGWWKYRPDGLHFLWLMKVCILQYAIVRPVCTLAAVGLQYFGLYCLESWEPTFGHIWISLAISISVTVAMYCVIQFYLPITEELKPYKPVLKFLAVKSVVFLTFWQDSFLSILVYFGAIKQSKYMTAADIQVGINALLETFEMVLFAFIHIKAFTYLIYRPQDRKRITRRGRAMLDVIDFRDWWYDMKHTTRYVTARSRGKDFTIVDDIRREKYQHLEKALGRDRWSHLQQERLKGKQNLPSFWKDGKDAEEETLLIESNDLEKAQVAMTTTEEEEESRQPKGNLAMRDDYDPETGEGDLNDEPIKETVKSKTVDKTSRPTLPELSYDLNNVAKPRHDLHPELTQYHLTSADEQETEEGDEYLFVPRKGGRARKEASAGMGAWWRAFRQRISGSAVEDAEGDEAGDSEETRIMLAEELGRGIALKAAADRRAEEEEDELLQLPPSGKEANESSGSSDASASVLQSRDSPLSLIINEHRTQEQQESIREGALSPPRFVPSFREKQVAAAIKANEQITRHGSTKVAMDSQDAASPPPHDIKQFVSQPPASNRERMGRVEIMSRSMQQAPHISSVVPSLSGTQAASISSAQLSHSLSTAELQRQRTQTKQSSNKLRSAGVKGKQISLVLPTPLSPTDFRPAPAPAPVPVPIPVSRPFRYDSSPASDSFSASQPVFSATQSASKIRFVEKKVPSRARDDPEAEPVKLAGTVVVGGQSLSQLQAQKQKQQREAEQRQRQQQQERLQQWQGRVVQEQQSRQGEQRSVVVAAAAAAASGRKEARRQEQQQKVLDQSSHTRSGLFGKKEQRPEHYISIPAPSQLAQMDNRQDPFAAAHLAQAPRSTSGSNAAPPGPGRPQNVAGRGSYLQQQRRTSAGPSFEVGSIVTRQDVIDASDPHRYRQAYPERTAPHREPIRHHSYATPHQAPMHSSHHDSRRPVRHSIGSSASRPVAVASYDRYSGEPAWVQDRRTQSRVETRRRQYEAPQGFQFDYID